MIEITNIPGILPEDPALALDILTGCKNKLWEGIVNEDTVTDLSKGINYKKTIVKRKSDNCFFRFEWKDNNSAGFEFQKLQSKWPLEGVQVFPRQEIRTITVYEQNQ